MKFLSFIVLMMLFNSALGQAVPNQAIINPVLVIHGGAGTIVKQNMSPEKERAYTEGLETALKKGYAILQQGGSSLDAVVTVVKALEDNPLFNAGKGCCIYK